MSYIGECREGLWKHGVQTSFLLSVFHIKLVSENPLSLGKVHDRCSSLLLRFLPSELKTCPQSADIWRSVEPLKSGAGKGSGHCGCSLKGDVGPQHPALPF